MILNKDENAVIFALAQTWNEFTRLSLVHPDEQTDFRKAIHDAQRIIMARPGQRELLPTAMADWTAEQQEVADRQVDATQAALHRKWHGDDPSRMPALLVGKFDGEVQDEAGQPVNIEKYNPKRSVIEKLTNVGGRFVRQWHLATLEEWERPQGRRLGYALREMEEGKTVGGRTLGIREACWHNLGEDLRKEGPEIPGWLREAGDMAFMDMVKEHISLEYLASADPWTRRHSP